MSIIAFNHRIGPVKIDCVISESHNSEIQITENPIENGAFVNDHAFVSPKKLTLEIVDKNAAQTFESLVRFQESRIPFSLITGLKVYRNMLIRNISPTRDLKHSRILRATMDLQEVIIVSTATAPADIAEAGETPSGLPGGEKSLSAAPASPERSIDSVTADRATGTVQVGDSPTVTLPEASTESIAYGALFP